MDGQPNKIHVKGLFEACRLGCVGGWGRGRCHCKGTVPVDHLGGVCGGLDKQNPCKEPVLGISLRVCCNGEGEGACNIHNNRQETIKGPFHLGVYGGESDSQHLIHNHLF